MSKPRMADILSSVLLSGTLAFLVAARAADDSVSPDRKTSQGASPEGGYDQPMKPDEPMPTGMAKPGMKKGDVRNSAEKKQTKLEKMMREEMK
jgi:hypothetical protein